MLRENLYFKMLKSIRDAPDCLLTQTEKTDFDTAMGARDFAGCFEQLDHHALPDKYKLIAEGVRYYKDINPLNDSIQSETNVVFADINDDVWKLHLKPLAYNSVVQHLYVFTSCSLLKDDGASLIDFPPSPQIWMGIEYIWEAIEDNAGYIQQFYQMVEQKARYRVILISNLVVTAGMVEDVFRIYSFAYMNRVNEGCFDVPDALKPITGRYVQPTLSMVSNKYEQYFDVYNALNDARHAETLLTQYMHVYQAIELLAYRMKMAKMVNPSSGMKQSPVRQLMAYAKTFKEDEVHSIISLFAKVFSGIESRLNTANLNAKCKTFLDQNYGISFPHTTMNNEHVAKLVYQLRNSIVHNKDTELHFSLNNIEEYKIVIPVIEDLMKILPESIVKLINDTAPVKKDAIEYKERGLNLY